METEEIEINQFIFLCECGQILRNHYPYQIVKHRISKKHILKLIQKFKDIENKENDKQKKRDKEGSITINFS